MKKIILENKVINLGTHQLTISTLTRWLLLTEALELINISSEDRGVDIDEEAWTKKAKPHKAIIKYIEERYSAALEDTILENNF